MNVSRMLRLALMLCLCLSGSGAALAAPDNPLLVEEVRKGMALESVGRFGMAASQYESIAQSTKKFGPIPTEARSLLLRRSLACRIRDSKGTPSDFRTIMRHYRLLCRLEPKNAAWPLLAAKGSAAQGNFLNVDFYLGLAVAPGMGPAPVVAQAKAYKSQCAIAIADAHKHDAIAARRVQDEIDRPIDSWFHPSDTMIYRSDNSGAGGGSSSYEGQKNAERNGDWDAARRFQNGQGSWSDTNRYGGR